LLFKTFYFIYFGPRLVQGIPRYEKFVVLIPSYATAENSLLDFFTVNQLAQPALVKMSCDFNTKIFLYKKNLKHHMLFLKAYNFSTSYQLSV
jgi:hypothetical protein